MAKKTLTAMALTAIMVVTTGIVNAYPQQYSTGFGFAGYNNYSNGAAAASAVNTKRKQIVQTTSNENNAYTNSEKNISNLRDHDEAPNAGYKTTFTYVEKDMSDYNPYTGADSGVNNTKSIYTDDLGRLHFFGKGSFLKSKN